MKISKSERRANASNGAKVVAQRKAAKAGISMKELRAQFSLDGTRKLNLYEEETSDGRIIKYRQGSSKRWDTLKAEKAPLPPREVQEKMINAFLKNKKKIVWQPSKEYIEERQFKQEIIPFPYGRTRKTWAAT